MIAREYSCVSEEFPCESVPDMVYCFCVFDMMPHSDYWR